MSLEIVDSNPNEPIRVVIYSEEGMGKSTFGAKSDNPIFIPAENGAARLIAANGKPIKMFKDIGSFDRVVEATKWLIKEPHSYQTAVYDSATQIERMAHQKICEGSGKSIKTIDKGYGAGHARSDQMHTELRDLMEELRLKREMNIIITAHAQIRANRDPEMPEDYDQFEMKLDKGVAGIWKEYCDAQFFVRLNTLVKTSEETKARAVSDGTRIVYTSKQAFCQAKNRYGMPEKMEFTVAFWNEFMQYAKQGIKPEVLAKEVRDEIAELYLKLTDQKLKERVAIAIEKAGDDVSKLKAIKTGLVEITGGTNG